MTIAERFAREVDIWLYSIFMGYDRRHNLETMMFVLTHLDAHEVIREAQIAGLRVARDTNERQLVLKLYDELDQYANR